MGIKDPRGSAVRCGSADDAEVVPPHAEVATGFTPGLIARTDRSQGHNRGINPLATWKCGRRGGERLRTTVVRTTRRSSLPGKVQVSASGDATVCGCSADDAEVVPPHAEVATGFTPGRIAAKGIIAG